MATVNFSVPENIKKQFNKTFSHENKSHIIAGLMQQAVDEHDRQQQRAEAIDALLKLRSKQKPISDKLIQTARKAGRS